MKRGEVVGGGGVLEDGGWSLGWIRCSLETSPQSVPLSPSDLVREEVKAIRGNSDVAVTIRIKLRCLN